MSTKIYTGFRLREVALATLQRRIRALRAKALEVAVEHMRGVIFRSAIERFDDACWRGALAPRDFLGQASSEVGERIRDLHASRGRDPAVDTRLELTFFPSRGHLLGMAWTEIAALLELVKTLPTFEEYGYWNNTDRPDGLTAAQWARRGRVWERALPGAGTPAEEGFSVTVLSLDSWSVQGPWCPWEDSSWDSPVCQDARALESRVARLARAEMTERMMARGQTPISGRVSKDPVFLALQDEVRAKLKPLVLVQDLRGHPGGACSA